MLCLWNGTLIRNSMPSIRILLVGVIILLIRSNWLVFLRLGSLPHIRRFLPPDHKVAALAQG